MTRPRLFALSTTCLLLLLTMVAPARNVDWEEAPQYHVDINGKPEISTRAYQPVGSAPYLLLRSDVFDTPLLIDLGARAVLAINAKDIREASEYMLSTSGIPKGRNVANYRVASGVTSFSVGGKTISIRVKESLVGRVSESIILAHSPVYALLRDAYKPQNAEIAFLKSYAKPTEVVVMFATWCPTCRQVLPKLMRIMKDAANRNFSVTYIGIALGGQEPRDELERYGHDYPAVILLQNGKEIHRVIGDPPGALEKALTSKLRGK